MALIVLVFLLFIVVVAIAPHGDMKMRGFAPCTVTMAEELNAGAGQKKMWEVISGVGRGYLCYAAVMREGVSLWLEGKQTTPWANYMFVPETYVASKEESELFSEDLLNANLLDEEEGEPFIINTEIKENIDDGK